MSRFEHIKKVEVPPIGMDTAGYVTDGRQHGRRPEGQDPEKDQITWADVVHYRNGHHVGDKIHLRVRVADRVKQRNARSYYICETAITGVYPRFCTTAAGISIPWIDLLTGMWIDVDPDLVADAPKSSLAIAK